MRKTNKNDRRKMFNERKKFRDSLKCEKEKSTQINDENVSDLIVEKKEDERIKSQEPPSVIIERDLMRQLHGHIGKKDIEDESR